jgi:hypothetical protein
VILSIHPNDRNDELTTALGEKADTPDIKARESRSFMVSCVLNGREDVRLMRKANSIFVRGRVNHREVRTRPAILMVSCYSSCRVSSENLRIEYESGNICRHCVFPVPSVVSYLYRDEVVIRCTPILSDIIVGVRLRSSS